MPMMPIATAHEITSPTICIAALPCLTPLLAGAVCSAHSQRIPLSSGAASSHAEASHLHRARQGSRYDSTRQEIGDGGAIARAPYVAAVDGSHHGAVLDARQSSGRA